MERPRSKEGEDGQPTRWWQIRASQVEVEVSDWPSLIGNPPGKKLNDPKILDDRRYAQLRT